jgi:hypothetical protein
MKLFLDIAEDVQYIEEATGEDGKKSLFIEGVFLQGGIKNRNGRMYPSQILENEVARYTKESIAANRAYGELGHPAGPAINLDRVSHMIKELRKDGNNYIGKAKIMETPMGNIVRNLIKEGAGLGVSSRGMGTLKAQNGLMEVQNDFRLATAADVVADPSAPDAFVQGIMEGVEWIWENGIFKQATLETAVQVIENHAAARTLDNERKMKIFEALLSGHTNQ